MIFVDTDILIDFLNGYEPAASGLAREGSRGELRTTVINRFELSLERKGAVIGKNDSLIAGIVLHHSGSLLTRNLRHFDPRPSAGRTVSYSPSRSDSP